jgi:hypothetical protein
VTTNARFEPVWFDRTEASMPGNSMIAIGHDPADHPSAEFEPHGA